jgi:hypothetical protein
MPYAGEAAEQTIRIALQGTEIVLRISGTGAKHLAALIAAAMSGHEKTAGKARLASMLKTEKELKVFIVPESKLRSFAKEAKRYGVLYCVLREKEPTHDGVTDILARPGDAPRINRISERLGIAMVDVGDISIEAGNQKADKTTQEQDSPEQDLIDSEKEDRLVDELLGIQPEGEKPVPENPTKAETERSIRSDSTSKTRGTSGKDTSEPPRKSVKKDMDEIRRERQEGLVNEAGREREEALRKRQQELGARTAGIGEGRTRA